MKRLGAFIMAICLIVSTVCSQNVFADTGAILSVENAEGKKGETVTIPIILKNLQELSGIQMTVVYNAEKVELISVNDTGFLSQPFIDSNMKKNPFILSWGAGIEKCNTGETGTAAILTLKLLDGFDSGSEKITVTVTEAYDMDLNEVSFTPNSTVAEITAKPDVHEHEFDEWIETVKTTCTQDGERKHICKICSYEETEKIEKTEHIPGEWVVEKEATCTDTGLEKQVCTVCKNTVATRTIDAEGHAGEWKIIKGATCTEKGLKKEICSRCGFEIASEEIDKIDHVAGEWKTEKEATCTEAGSQIQVCVNCGEKMGEKTIPMVAHTYGNWTTIKEATILSPGLEERICTKCDTKEQREIPQITHGEKDHIFDGKEVVTKEATCTESGSKNVYCSVEHCDYYQVVVIPAKGHTEGKWEITKSATCMEDGERVKKCTICNEILGTEKIIKTEHRFGEWIAEKEATCKEAGEEKRVCDKCKIEETRSIPKKDHTVSGWEVSKAATCIEKGEMVKTCTFCQEIIERKYIDMTDHSYGPWKVVKEATCTEKGEKASTCSVCHNILTEIVPKKEHTEGDWKVIKEATCTETGEKVKKCTECNSIIVKEVIPALGHLYGEIAIVKAATCSEAGCGEKVCGRCKTVLEVAIPAVGHAYGDKVVIKEPTFMENGEAQRVCELCKDMLVEVIPKLSESHEHDFAGTQEVIKEATCMEKGVVHIHCVNPECDAYKVVEYAEKGHQFGEWITIKQPTVKETGEKQRICMICQFAQKEAVDKITDTALNPLENNKTNIAVDNPKAGVQGTANKNSVNTGDGTPLAMLIGIMILAGMAVCVCGGYSIKRHRENSR